MKFKKLLRTLVRDGQMDKRKIKRHLLKVQHSSLHCTDNPDLWCAFAWGDSPQGYHFWRRLAGSPV